MRIALVAPPFSRNDGPGIVVKNLFQALQKKQGIEVTLFAPGDWDLPGNHKTTIPKSLREIKGFLQQTPFERRNLIFENILKVSLFEEQFDIIHLHSQYAYALASILHKPCVLTLHNKIIPEEIRQLQRQGVNLVALSKLHGRDFPSIPVISNGINLDDITPSFSEGNYLIFIGRLHESKGAHTAIEIALKTNSKLLIFGRIGNSEKRQAYFREKIAPFLNEHIIHKDETTQAELFSYLRHATALLCPIQSRRTVCPLVMMESLACGTPIIGCEVAPLEELPGWQNVATLSGNINTLIRSVKTIKSVDRNLCRTFAKKHFCASIMAEKYLQLYQRILGTSL